jgi:sec-independent protein translocase protein TatA
MFGGRIGFMELILILAICLLIFGGKKIPEIAKSLGSGIRDFKKGLGTEETPGQTPPVDKNVAAQNVQASGQLPSGQTGQSNPVAQNVNSSDTNPK